MKSFESVGSTLLVAGFVNCLLLVFSLPQVCSRSAMQAPTCVSLAFSRFYTTTSSILQEFHILSSEFLLSLGNGLLRPGGEELLRFGWLEASEDGQIKTHCSPWIPFRRLSSLRTSSLQFPDPYQIQRIGLGMSRESPTHYFLQETEDGLRRIDFKACVGAREAIFCYHC